MQGTRDELLAGARLAEDEHRSVALGDALHEVVDPSHAGAIADQGGVFGCLRERLS